MIEKLNPYITDWSPTAQHAPTPTRRAPSTLGSALIRITPAIRTVANVILYDKNAACSAMFCIRSSVTASFTVRRVSLSTIITIAPAAIEKTM
jgi:hypothetical protein